MPKFYSLFLSIFCLFFACTPKNDSLVEIFNAVNFQLLKGEKVVVVDSISNNHYKTYFNDHEMMQIPLFKQIQADNYTLFIGLPFRVKKKDIVSKFSSIGQVEESENLAAILTQKDSLYLKQIVFEFNNATVCIFGTTSSKKIATSIFLTDSIKKRFIFQ